MLSLLTNTSAMSAVSALAVTQRSLGKVQGEIASGLRIAAPKDNAAYWSIATSMNTRIGLLSAVDDGLDLTSSIISTTTAALTTILGLTQGIAKDLVTAQTSGVDVANVQTDITAKQQQILSAAQSATFNGVNWLVTQVTGTNTTTRSDVFDADYATVAQISGIHTNGTFTDALTSSSVQDVTRTLASTSVATSQDDSSGLFTYTSSTANGGVGTDTVSNGTSVYSSYGDPTGYRTGLINLSIASDDSIVSSAQDFHQTELFQSFTGSSGASNTSVYTDRTTTSGTPVTALTAQAPYDGSSADILDAAFSLAGGSSTTLLTMVLRDAGDAATAAPVVDSAIKGLTSAMSFLGGLQNTVDGSKSINTAISDALKSGVGRLVDADMNEASTRLQALQTQQSLGVQALGIANSNSSIVTKLFGA